MTSQATSPETRRVAALVADLLAARGYGVITQRLRSGDGWRAEWMGAEAVDVVTAFKPDDAPWVSIGTTVGATAPKRGEDWEALLTLVSDFDLACNFVRGPRPYLLLAARIYVLNLAVEVVERHLDLLAVARREVARFLAERGL